MLIKRCTCMAYTRLQLIATCMLDQSGQASGNLPKLEELKFNDTNVFTILFAIYIPLPYAFAERFSLYTFIFFCTSTCAHHVSICTCTNALSTAC